MGWRSPLARRTNHPLKSFLLFVVACGLAWLAWDYIHVQGGLKSESVAPDTSTLCEEARNAILERFQNDYCLDQIDPIHYRTAQDHYRVRFTVPHDCTGRARDMCVDIADYASTILDATVGVFAFDPAGNEIAKYVQ